LGADKSALRDLTKREQLIKTFTNRIDVNVDLFNNFKSNFKTDWPKIGNMTLRAAYAGAIGSGDLAALRLILFSIENETAKVESGNLGIGGVTEGAANITRKIHDLNLPIKELETVLQMSKTLGKTSAATLEKQRKELKGRIGGGTPAVEKEDPLGIR
jgi:hypothetical protein